jgi:hypothetical protein
MESREVEYMIDIADAQQYRANQVEVPNSFVRKRLRSWMSNRGVDVTAISRKDRQIRVGTEKTENSSETQYKTVSWKIKNRNILTGTTRVGNLNKQKQPPKSFL